MRSFTKAADYLNLTQSAVSFQVRKLEAELGLPLFTRGQRSLILTPEGARFIKAVEAALEILRAERVALTAANIRPQLVISVSFSFNSRWLVPRLLRLQELLKEVDLRIDTNDRTVDLVREGVDVAVRYCNVPPQGLQSERLLLDHVFPVCTPALRDTLRPSPSPDRLGAITFLHDHMTDFDWPKWLASIGISLPLANRGPRFSHTAGAIEAAIGGQGIALGRPALVADDLESGRLVRPFDHVAVSDFAYFVLWPHKPRRPDLTAIALDWLRFEAKRTEANVFGSSMS